MNPVAFTVFGIDIMWYGVLISTSILIALGLSLYQIDESKGLTKDEFVDMALYIILGGILGARLYFVMFYDFKYYMTHPLQILNFREGGLAIHGGILAGILIGYIYTRKKNIKFLYYFDIVSPGLALAQSISRWGNYINQEAYGTPTDLPWGILIDGVKVHPTFLYESICNFILFLVLFFIIRKNKKFDGQMASIYLIVYGVVRIFVEGLRTDSLMLGPIRVAQLISGLAIVAGLVIYRNGQKKK